MKEKYEKKGGFTLVEMLIVIVTVGLLSTLAIGGYSHYRKASLLDVAGDNIVAVLYKARDEVRFGAVGRGGAVVSGEVGGVDVNVDDVAGSGEIVASRCEGLWFGFETGSVGGGVVNRISSEYGDKKKWVDGRWENAGCGAVETGGARIELDDLVFIEDIKVDAGEVINECGILFVPPYGDVVLRGGCEGRSTLAVVVKYGDSDGDSYKRFIEIDLKNVIANVKKNVEK